MLDLMLKVANYGIFEAFFSDSSAKIGRVTKRNG